MKPRMFFVIVGLLLLLTAAGIGAGTLQGGDTGDPVAIPDWGERIRSVLKQPLSSDDVRTAFPSACRDQMQARTFVLLPGSGCTLIIAQSRANVRTLTLVLTQGTRATVEVNPADETQMKYTRTLEMDGNGPGDKSEAEIMIFKEGGGLEIRCTAAGPCRLEVAQ
jgi:hypothetical protein